MMTENIQALVTCRLEQADESLEAARTFFDRDFVKQGIFKKEYSRWLHDAFDLRQRSDYAAEYHASPEDAESTLNNAETFVAKVKDVLSRAT